MDGQIKNKWDKISQSKAFKSLMLTLSGIGFYAIINILQWAETINFGNEAIESLVALLIPFIINSIREYRKGE